MSDGEKVVEANPEKEPTKAEKEAAKADKEVVRVGSSVREGKVVRTKNACFRVLDSPAWGKYLIPSDDPEGVELSDFELNGIQLKVNFPKIPTGLWSRYIDLCFHLCPQTNYKMTNLLHDSQLEVQVCLLRDSATMQKWKIVVPKQIVSGTSVRAELANSIDIATGERYTQFPPLGWIHAGSSHSHNTMGAFFSSVDDRSELNVPGFHAVVGGIKHSSNEYSHIASVVLRKLRKEVELEDVVELDHDDDVTFHPEVLEYISTVMEANRALYEKKEQERKEREEAKKAEEEAKKVAEQTGEVKSEPRETTPRFKMRNEENESDRISIPVADLLSDEKSGFYNMLDRSNSDLFDDDALYPFEDDVESIVEHSFDLGFSLHDIVSAVHRANRKRNEKKYLFQQDWND